MSVDLMSKILRLSLRLFTSRNWKYFPEKKNYILHTLD